MRLSRLALYAAFLSCWALVVPPRFVSAASSAPHGLQAVDIALGQGGVFHGQLLNAQAVPLSGVDVAVRNAQGDLARAVTDQQGKFVLRDVPAGVHQVILGSSLQVVRFWAPNAAPPSAKPALLVVAAEDVVRGKGDLGGAGEWWQNLSPACKLLLLGGVAAAIAIPIALAADDDGS
jgi:hypothetical protein